MKFTRRGFLATTGAAGLAACTPAVHQGADADVIIIGAGLSGLQTARLLAADGAKVLVLEAASRVGGRMHTLDDVPGNPESGGSQVGQGYARIRKAALDVGVSLKAFPEASIRGQVLALDNELIAADEWASHPKNPFPEELKRATPASILFAAAAAENPFEHTGSWQGARDASDISAADFLRSKGFSEDGLALANVSLNANDLSTYSMANLWRSLTLFSKDRDLGPSEAIVGGSSALLRAMATSLGDGVVKLNTPVQQIDASKAGRISVTTPSGTYRAPFCVASLPFGALKRVKIKGPVPALQRNAMRALPYTQIQQVHLTVENAFWEADGLPPAMWTNSPIERVFPSLSDTGEIIGLICWINGTGTNTDATDADWMALAEDTLRELRGANTTAHKVVRWDTSNALAGGAYMHWAPGQIADWYGKMGQSVNGLHFAGEHLSRLHTGMEGAMESAEWAAYDIAEAMAGGVDAG